MNLQQAKAILRPYGCSIRWTGDDYRVCLLGDPEIRAYYTDDLQDAVDTGIAMKEREEAFLLRGE